MSKSRHEQLSLITASLVILATVALAYVLAFTKGVMVPFVLAVFVVAMVAPIADYLELRARFPRWLSMMTVSGIVLVVAAIGVLLLAYTFGEITRTATRYTGLAYTMLQPMLSAEQAPGAATSEKPVEDRTAETDAAGEDEARRTSPLKELIDPERIRDLASRLLESGQATLLSLIGRGIGSATDLLGMLMLVTIFVLFLLAGRDPRKSQQGVYAEVESKIRKYLIAKMALSTVTGVLVAILLSLIRLDLAIVFGVLAFLLNFIPSVGSIIATILPLPIAFAQFIAHIPLDAPEALVPDAPQAVAAPSQDTLPGSAANGIANAAPLELDARQVAAGNDSRQPPEWWKLIAAILLPGFVQLVIGNVIEPRIMGEGLELHPITILFALAFWGLLWGPIGAILAVPITAVIRIATSRFAALQIVTDALAGRLPE